MHKPAELLDAALCAVDEAREVFVDKVGAAPAPVSYTHLTLPTTPYV